MKVILKKADEGFHFKAKGASEIYVDIDGSKEIGGNDCGVRPMELVLMGLGSCGAMDIVSILKKQKQMIEDLEIIVHAERDYNQVPAIFKEINIEFNFSGNLDRSKVERAVQLSMDKYCSVSAMLEKTAKISYSFNITE